MAELSSKKSLSSVVSSNNKDLVCPVICNSNTTTTTKGLIDLDVQITTANSNNQLIALCGVQDNNDDDDQLVVLTNNMLNEPPKTTSNNDDKSLQELIESELAMRISSSNEQLDDDDDQLMMMMQNGDGGHQLELRNGELEQHLDLAAEQATTAVVEREADVVGQLPKEPKTEIDESSGCCYSEKSETSDNVSSRSIHHEEEQQQANDELLLSKDSLIIVESELPESERQVYQNYVESDWTTVEEATKEEQLLLLNDDDCCSCPIVVINDADDFTCTKQASDDDDSFDVSFCFVFLLTMNDEKSRSWAKKKLIYI